MSERCQLWIVGKEGYVSPSLCTWPTKEGAEELRAQLEEEDLRLEGQIVVDPA